MHVVIRRRNVNPPIAAVFLDYDQAAYVPTMRQSLKRWVSNSDLVRKRLGAPRRFSYGNTEAEALDLFPTKRPNAPIFIIIHGGAWRAISPPR